MAIGSIGKVTHGMNYGGPGHQLVGGVRHRPGHPGPPTWPDGHFPSPSSAHAVALGRQSFAGKNQEKKKQYGGDVRLCVCSFVNGRFDCSGVLAWLDLGMISTMRSDD